MSDRPAESSTRGLRSQVTQGAAFTAVAQAARTAIQLGSVVILSRLLSPSEFGLFGMVGPIYGFVMMFQDFGLTQATIQKSDISHRQLSTLFWINFGVSVGLGLALMAAAPLIAGFYGESRVTGITLAFGAMMMIAGLGSQHMALLNRNMRFGLLSLIDGLAAAAGLLASVLVALALHNYWALVAGSLASTVTPTLLAWLNVRWAPGRPARAEGMGDILGFGAGITGFNISNFFARNLDNVLIGRAWGEASLGLYDRAYKLLLFPMRQVTGPLSRVMLPVLSRLMAEPERYRRAYLNTLSQMMLIVIPGVAWMITSSDLLVHVLLGPQWQAAAPIFGALGFAALVQPIISSSGWLFLSQGRARGFMQWGLFFTGISIASFLVGLPWGAHGVAIAYAVSEIAKTPLIWWAMTRRGPITFGDMLVSTSPHLFGAVVSLALTFVVREELHLNAWLEMIICLVVAYLGGWGVVALSATGRAAFAESLELAVGMLRRVWPKPA